jgi:hypothetical protein
MPLFIYTVKAYEVSFAKAKLKMMLTKSVLLKQNSKEEEAQWVNLPDLWNIIVK